MFDSVGISNPVYNIEKSKLKKEIVNYSREHNFLGKFLCQSCLNKTENLIGIKPSSILQSLDEIINCLNHETPEILSKIPTDIWTQLINLLGEKIIKPKKS